MKIEVEYWPIAKLKEYANNAKTHPQSQIDKIANSIKLYGFDQPISVDKEGVIIKGHGRLLAAEKLGFSTVPVIVRNDLTLIEAAASRIADNKVAESPWDENLLPLELQMLEDAGLDVAESTGFSDDELKKIFNLFEPATQEEQGKLDEKDPTICPACGHAF